MRDERASSQNNNVQSISHTIEDLENQWKVAPEPSLDSLKRITEFVNSLPDSYRTAGLTAIGVHFANNLILHFLDAMSTFQQATEQEGIGSKERDEYLHYILTELYPKIIGLNKVVAVTSLDDLAVLTAITVNLQTLSHLDSAEEAQNWMYEIPIIYPDELSQENLLTDTHALESDIDSSNHTYNGTNGSTLL